MRTFAYASLLAVIGLVRRRAKGWMAIGLTRVAAVAILLALGAQQPTYAAGPVTITQVVHCSDNSGTIFFQLSDGNSVFLYDSTSTDQFSKNMQAMMLVIWTTGATIQSYAVTTNAGSACGVYGLQLSSVTTTH